MAGSVRAEFAFRPDPVRGPVRGPRLGRFAIPGSGVLEFAVHPVRGSRRVRALRPPGSEPGSRSRLGRFAVRGSGAREFAVRPVRGSRRVRAPSPTRFGMAQPTVAQPQQNLRAELGRTRLGSCCAGLARFGFAVGLVRGSRPGSRRGAGRFGVRGSGSRGARFGFGFGFAVGLVRGSRPGSGFAPNRFGVRGSRFAATRFGFARVRGSRGPSSGSVRGSRGPGSRPVRST